MNTRTTGTRLPSRCANSATSGVLSNHIFLNCKQAGTPQASSVGGPQGLLARLTHTVCAASGRSGPVWRSRSTCPSFSKARRPTSSASGAAAPATRRACPHPPCAVTCKRRTMPRPRLCAARASPAHVPTPTTTASAAAHNARGVFLKDSLALRDQATPASAPFALAVQRTKIT